VVTGPPNGGKSTWCRARALDGDLVWDFDVLASAMTLGGRERPRGADGSQGPWPWPTMKAMLVMRDALVAWLRSEDLSSAAVYMIVRDPVEARTIARLIGAEVVECDRSQWV
jgi:hypothetical protein